MSDLFVKEWGELNRQIAIWKEREDCKKCKKKLMCLAADSSDGEYSTIYICFACIEELKKIAD